MNRYILILIMIVALELSAATFTSIRNGNWSNQGTWDKPQIPGIDDIVIVNHSVFIRETVTIGRSLPDELENAAVEVADGGSLTLKNDAALHCRGPVFVRSGSLVLDPGAVLELDASHAVNPFGKTISSSKIWKVSIPIFFI